MAPNFKYLKTEVIKSEIKTLLEKEPTWSSHAVSD